MTHAADVNEQAVNHARRQDGLVTREQLSAAGITRSYVRAQVSGRRWRRVTARVIATFTGALTADQYARAAALNAGRHAVLGGIDALRFHGLSRWDDEHVAVYIPAWSSSPKFTGARYIRTKLELPTLSTARYGQPMLKVEPAALLWASRTPHHNSARGLLAACVQQRLTTPKDLSNLLQDLGPIPRAPFLREQLAELSGGAQSGAEMDVRRYCKAFDLVLPARQVRRRDATGRVRYTDCEWCTIDGRSVVLEVDGAFHMEVSHWEDDIARQRALTATSVALVRCTTRELRELDPALASDLVRMGVARARSRSPERPERHTA